MTEPNIGPDYPTTTTTTPEITTTTMGPGSPDSPDWNGNEDEDYWNTQVAFKDKSKQYLGVLQGLVEITGIKV